MAKPKKKYTEPVSLPMLPLRGLMVFPHMVLHFDAGRKKSIAALDQAMEENQRIFLVAQRDMDVDDPAVDDIYHVGTIACVKQVLRLPGGNVRLLVEGKSRAVLRAVTQEEPYFVGALDEVLEQGTPVSIETDALLRTAHHYFEEYCKMSGRISGETMQSVLEIEDPGQLADIIAANVLSKIEDRQQVLEEFDELARLESVCALLVRETELAGVEKKVQARVRKQIEQNQKDYFLREQIKAIQTELGDKDATDVEDLRERLAKTPMNDEARDKANRELERLSRMAPGSPEIGVSRTYIEWLLDLPWGKTTPDNLDLKRARRILAEDHYGLDEVKQWISGRLCAFCGNSGVGKSTLLNHLLPEAERETSAISQKLGRGRHTTREVTIFEAFGGRIADTPGFASLEANRAGFIPKENLEHAFPEFGPYLGQCQFTGCSHRSEKGCAVRAALAEGRLSQTRYDSYCAMYEEVKDVKDWQRPKV